VGPFYCLFIPLYSLTVYVLSVYPTVLLSYFLYISLCYSLTVFLSHYATLCPYIPLYSLTVLYHCLVHQVGEPIYISVEDKADVAAFADYALAATPTPTPTPAAPAPVAAPAVKAAPAAPAPVAPIPAPAKVAPPAPPAPKAVSTPPPTSTTWGSGVKKSALAKMLGKQQQEYVLKYGRCAQKPI